MRLSDRVLTSSCICVLITDFKMALYPGISFKAPIPSSETLSLNLGMAVGRGLCMTQWRDLTHQQLYLCLDHKFLDGIVSRYLFQQLQLHHLRHRPGIWVWQVGGACVRWAGLVRLSDRVLTSSFICVLITDFKMALDNGISFSSSNYTI